MEVPADAFKATSARSEVGERPTELPQVLAPTEAPDPPCLWLSICAKMPVSETTETVQASFGISRETSD
eukprot:7005529-Pyramimonas_sp.AAC.1